MSDGQWSGGMTSQDTGAAMTTSMRAIILRGDAAHLPLPDASVDLIVTSPPYFGLRSYTDAGEHYDGQIGSEATPRAYLEALWACTAEWVRVLKPSGSLFVNLGDKYSTGNSGQSGLAELGKRWAGGGHSDGKAKRASAAVPGLPPKTLLGIPWRYALGCTDDLGLILRAEIVWAKPNGLPESVTDRVRRSHEQVFHFTRQPRYYSAVDEVREVTPDIGRKIKSVKAGPLLGSHGSTAHDGNGMRMGEVYNNPLGKMPGSVWSIPSAPLTVPAHLGVDHFAAYPPELVRRIILGWSPAAVCTGCGEGRRPVAFTDLGRKERITPAYTDVGVNGSGRHGKGASTLGSRGPSAVITGYACACPDAAAPATPGVVLDPFAGTGTTMLVASVFGRTGIGIDRSADYCRLAQWRCSDPGERARALDVPKPPPVADGQEPLF
jgi:DNA modification methylase